ncbi:hypothetical protein C8Q69DRAFT_458087 [Paecilomyces variotii]|uniref:Kelch repeat protein n=1 Tax=Byssochlamys spectabilis TaxID=264951 RepID=A0A443I298_BYSSP|nr:hypothetical protein C8Q69DRAFT_458087 [Paecilomyces variotii]RWQ98209.1 hypothetical protein C8Q69DRAFT_458087 [Paecilomyces variotii]
MVEKMLFLLASIALMLCDKGVAVGWENNVNISICNWQQLRANIIRDTIYLDGGSTWYRYGESDGQWGQLVNDGNVHGLLYTLNLGLPFDNTTNQTGLLQSMEKAGSSASNNIAPNYKDGVMFANDDEFILYGGLALFEGFENAQLPNQILGYEADQWGPYRESWSPGFLQKTLPNGATRFVTNGAGVSVPSENLGFYFSGMRSEDWGLIAEGGFPNITANVTANTLISVNMTTMRDEKWENDTLPDNIPARANAELVWIPVSESGALIAMGGVTDPEVLNPSRSLTEEQMIAANSSSRTFMTSLPVYDIANKKWYLQNTTGDIPPQTASFCSVVAAAPDNSSYNIYIYGGYNGVYAEDPPYDDVYVLSVPSFTWIKVYSGQQKHARSGHKCIKTYPDQMFVLGGIFEGDSTICLDGGFIQVFNLNTLRFQDSYSPEQWNEYQVPSIITDKIGGNANGAATKTAPAAWADDSLATLFSSKYTKTMPTYYPYALVSNTSTPTATSVTPTKVPSPSNSHNPLPVWVGPVLGVVLGFIVIAVLVVCLLVYRWRQYKRALESGDASHGSTHSHVLNWMKHGMHMRHSKSSVPAVSEVEANEKHTSYGFSAGTPAHYAVSPVATEASGLPIHELDAAPQGRFELETPHNSPIESYFTSGRHYSSSLDSVVMSGQHDNKSPTESFHSSEGNSPTVRSGIQRQTSDLSSPLSDISEHQSESRPHSRDSSDHSNELVSPLAVIPRLRISRQQR